MKFSESYFLSIALICSILLCGLTVSAPLAATFGYYKISLINYWGFHTVCHQRPERAFWICGYPLAVCARCSGIYGGILFGSVCCNVSLSFISFIKSRITLYKLYVCFVPLLLDVMFHQIFFLADYSLTRAFTGYIAGIGISCFVLSNCYYELINQKTF